MAYGGWIFYLQSSIFYNYFPFSTIYRQKMNQKIKLMTHVVVGHPSIKVTEELILLMDKVEVDFIELQIPFSDPLADGPTIMKACEESLKKGTKVADAFSLASRLNKKVKTPLLFMAYFNIVYQYGIEKFCKDSQEAGIKGLIVPDFPLEEESTKHFSIPIALGFGISKKEHINEMKGLADIAVVGSAILDIINNNPKKYFHLIEEFLQDM